MNNPYAPTLEPTVAKKWKLRYAVDTGLLGLLVIAWLVTTYAVALPGSKMIMKDWALIAMSPVVPVCILVYIVAGETSWAQLLAIFAIPLALIVLGRAMGIRRNATWFAVMTLAVLYGLFLRLFYLLVEIN